MKQHKMLAALALALIMAACGAGDEDARPGERSVYDRIDGMTDCAGLQSEFDTAMSNVDRLEPGSGQRDIALSYARAAEARRQAIGC